MEQGEVRIRQYLRPNGNMRTIIATIDKERAEKAKNLRISCECLPTDEIVIYGKHNTDAEEEEITEIATNGPGENEPNIALCRLIDRL